MSWFKRRPEHPIDEELSALIDAQEGKAGHVADHVGGCEVCSARLAELRSVKTALSALPRPLASRQFTLGAEQALPRPRPERRAAFAFAPAVALSLFVALLAVDLAFVSDGSRGVSDDQASTALANSAEERALEPATAAAEGEAAAGAAAQDGDAAQDAATPPEAPPAPTTLTESFAQEPEATQQTAEDESAALPDEVQDGGSRSLLRPLQALAALGFVATLAVFLRQRRA